MIYFRCRIPECDGQDAIYKPEWLRDAVPYTDDKPSSCDRYRSFNASHAAAAEFAANNETACWPDIFDNSTTVKCQEWVFDTEELTIANEVTFPLYERESGLTFNGLYNVTALSLDNRYSVCLVGSLRTGDH